MTLKFISDVSGGRLLNENGIEVLKVDAGGNVVLASILKQSKAKRSFFSVYLGSNFGVIPAGAWTLIRTYTEIVDSATAFEPTTNGRYQPLVAGWYQINCGCTIAGGAGIQAVADIYKNNGPHKRIGSMVSSTPISINCTFSTGTAVYFNGTTDYIDMRVVTDMTSANVLGDANGEYTWMNGYLIEAD